MLRAPEFRDGTNAVLARARAKPEGRVRWTKSHSRSSRTPEDRTGRSPHPRSVIGRRDLIKLTAGAGVAAVGVAGRGLILPWVSTSRAAEGEPLVEPEVRASRDGLLDTTLEASVMAVPVAGGRRSCGSTRAPSPARRCASARGTPCASTWSTTWRRCQQGSRRIARFCAPR